MRERLEGRNLMHDQRRTAAGTSCCDVCVKKQGVGKLHVLLSLMLRYDEHKVAISGRAREADGLRLNVLIDPLMNPARVVPTKQLTTVGNQPRHASIPITIGKVGPLPTCRQLSDGGGVRDVKDMHGNEGAYEFHPGEVAALKVPPLCTPNQAMQQKSKEAF
jgi:hypothetical protein